MQSYRVHGWPSLCIGPAGHQLAVDVDTDFAKLQRLVAVGFVAVGWMGGHE